jgi:uncharacterized protein (TIGR00369 family)
MNGRSFTPRDPDFAQRVTASFERQGIMRLLGARLTRIEPGLCEIQLPYRQELSQQHGYFHAGVSGTIGDSAGGYAGFTLFPAASSVLTVEFKINLLAPADGDLLIATGRVIRAGRTLTVAEFDVEVEKNGERTACAHGVQTLMTILDRPDRPA